MNTEHPECIRVVNRSITSEGSRTSLLLKLPYGVIPGSSEALKAWDNIFSELRVLYPDERFQFIPYAYMYGETLEAILATST